jgi:putative phage-type endonuclease
MRIVDCEQGTPEWLQARLGKVGESMVADATARTKTGWGASRANLAARLVAERLTGNLTETFINAAMQWGTDTEPEARTRYAFETDADVRTVGLVLHPSIEWTCASPDGLVGDLGLVEIKCPNTATQIETLLGAAIDGKYVKQMQWQMACTGRSWCDFVSYDPRLPAEMQIHTRRVERDNAMIAELEEQIAEFLAEVASKVDRLSELYVVEAAA